jgi:acylphosphatase
MSEIVRRSLLIKGKVQGVWYRKSTKDKADELGLTGWVKNNPDGTVSAEVQGDSGMIDEFVHWCGSGPPNALVSSVDVTEMHTVDHEIDFLIHR